MKNKKFSLLSTLQIWKFLKLNFYSNFEVDWSKDIELFIEFIELKVDLVQI